MSVQWLGYGKIGYFMKLKCPDQKSYANANAKKIANILLPAFKAAESANNFVGLVGACVALVSAVISPIPGDEVAVSAAVAETGRKLVDFIISLPKVS